MNKLLALLLLIFISSAHAQESVVFFNQQTNKQIKANPGSTLFLTYKGYMGQREYYKNTLSVVTDSSVILGIYIEPSLLSEKLFFAKQQPYKEILFNDIIAFKKASAGRGFLKSALSVGAAYTAFFFTNQILKEKPINTLQYFGITLSIGLGSTILINQLFSEKPKHKIKDGWRIIPN